MLRPLVVLVWDGPCVDLGLLDCVMEIPFLDCVTVIPFLDCVTVIPSGIVLHEPESNKKFVFDLDLVRYCFTTLSIGRKPCGC